jgi:hypothetical protein
VSGQPVGPAADVYALGLMLLECLTGQRPFEGTAMEVAMARINRDPELPATLPVQWRDLLRAMTARDAAQRVTAPQAADALRRLAAGEDFDRTTVLPGPVTTPPDATSVLPATAVVSQQMPAYQPRPAPAPAAAAARRGPSAVVIAAFLVVVVAAVAIGIALARQNNSSGSTVQPGHPTLRQPLEDDVYQLEKLVHR